MQDNRTLWKNLEVRREGLIREEDDELRRLWAVARFGELTGELEERFVELRLRDRRKEVREPRSEDIDQVTTGVVRVIPPHDRAARNWRTTRDRVSAKQ